MNVSGVFFSLSQAEETKKQKKKNAWSQVSKETTRRLKESTFNLGLKKSSWNLILPSEISGTSLQPLNVLTYSVQDDWVSYEKSLPLIMKNPYLILLPFTTKKVDWPVL